MRKTDIIDSIKKGLIVIVGLVIFVLVVLLVYLSLNEYKPNRTVQLKINSQEKPKINLDDTLTLLTFNIGYAALDKEADFFMDGGKGVNAESREKVENNLDGIVDILNKHKIDFYALQEVDLNSHRSFYINEQSYIEDRVFGENAVFAPNYRVKYVPYPWPPIGKVDSGLMTYSDYEMLEAYRIGLTVPFKWPIKIANLKRCLLVSYHPIVNSNKKFVFINLHLEAYDDSGGREQQTKELLEIMGKEYINGNYVVAAGDWNQSFKQELDLKEDKFWVPGVINLELIPEGWTLTTDLKEPTCRILNQPLDFNSDLTRLYYLDGFLVSPNVKIEDVKTLPESFGYSDHNPVILKISLIE